MAKVGNATFLITERKFLTFCLSVKIENTLRLVLKRFAKKLHFSLLQSVTGWVVFSASEDSDRIRAIVGFLLAFELRYRLC